MVKGNTALGPVVVSRSSNNEKEREREGEREREREETRRANKEEEESPHVAKTSPSFSTAVHGWKVKCERQREDIGGGEDTGGEAWLNWVRERRLVISCRDARAPGGGLAPVICNPYARAQTTPLTD